MCAVYTNTNAFVAEERVGTLVYARPTHLPPAYFGTPAIRPLLGTYTGVEDETIRLTHGVRFIHHPHRPSYVEPDEDLPPSETPITSVAIRPLEIRISMNADNIHYFTGVRSVREALTKDGARYFDLDIYLCFLDTETRTERFA